MERFFQFVGHHPALLSSNTAGAAMKGCGAAAQRRCPREIRSRSLIMTIAIVSLRFLRGQVNIGVAYGYQPLPSHIPSFGPVPSSVGQHEHRQPSVVI